MALGAIVVVDGDRDVPGAFRTSHLAESGHGETPLSFVEILGRPLLEHMMARLIAADVEAITLIIHTDAFPRIPKFRGSLGNVAVEVTEEVWSMVSVTLMGYAERGISYSFVLKPTAYTEADIVDLLDFHRQGNRAVTRASDHAAPLDFWVVNCNGAGGGVSALSSADGASSLAAGYFVKEYSKRITDLRDIRQLVPDAFLGRCQLRPGGMQIRPGVWAEEGVNIGRGARIVAPAYLGRGAEIKENTLVTRCSNIESFSYVDYGTVIEDSSVMPNTYVGIWLDVRHSVVRGNKLLSLKRNVMVEISDSSLIRSNSPNRQDVRGKSSRMSVA